MFAGVGKQNVKVVLSGTDSLSFQFVEDGSALGRQLSVHTSYIPFKDFSRLLGENDFDKFIEYGGTLVPETPDGNPNYTLSPFASPAAAGQYLDSAISQNILHSLQNKKVGERYSSLEPLIESGQLRKVINHIVAYVNVSSLFTEKGISDKSKIFRCPNLGQMRNIIKEHWEKHCSHTVPTISKEQFEDELLNQYYERLGFRTFQNLKNINDSQLHDIQKYLLALKVAQLIPNVNITLVQHIKTDGTPASEIEVENVTRDNVFTITQPGMRFSLNKEMLKILEENKIIVDKKEFISEVNSVKGRIMEDTVLSELIYATERWNNILKFKYNEANNRYLNFDVFKLNLRYKTITEDPITKKEKTKSYDKEIDMVIFDPLSDGYHLFEIKHTTEKLDLATEHMLSYKVEWAFNNALYGDIIDREVLYRGKNGVENNVRYRNVGDFLKTINNNMIGSIFSSLEENKDVENANIQYEWNEKTPDYTLWDR